MCLGGNADFLCYNTTMFLPIKKKLWLGCLAGICMCAAGCAYHGQVRRGIYKPSVSDNRLASSVLVVSDEGVPEKISITDPTSSALYVGRVVPVAAVMTRAVAWSSEIADLVMLIAGSCQFVYQNFIHRPLQFFINCQLSIINCPFP